MTDIDWRTLVPGTQIAYVPTHADGNVFHPDVEFGFVVRESASGPGLHYFCRYWRKGHPGELRTVANSENTPLSCLVLHESVPQAVVDKWMQEHTP